MKKSSYDDHLNDKLKDPVFKEMFEEEKELLKLAYQISQLRQQAKLTQNDMAQRMGTTQSVIARIENGHQNLSFAMLQKIAAALGKNMDIRFI